MEPVLGYFEHRSSSSQEQRHTLFIRHKKKIISPPWSPFISKFFFYNMLASNLDNKNYVIFMGGLGIRPMSVSRGDLKVSHVRCAHA
jgi:hypothetical protein